MNLKEFKSHEECSLTTMKLNLKIYNKRHLKTFQTFGNSVTHFKNNPWIKEEIKSGTKKHLEWN